MSIATTNPLVFAPHNLHLRFRALDGPNAGRRYSPGGSKESVKVDPGGKTIVLKGMSSIPVGIAQGAAEPSAEIKFSNAAHAWAFGTFLGGGRGGQLDVRFDATFTWAKRGLATRVFELKSCMVEKGFGFDSGADASPSDTLSVKLVDILLDGKSIFHV